jgi:ATP-dependent RNA helicase DeaD
MHANHPRFAKLHQVFIGAHVVAIYGGASIEGQIRDVKKGPQIIVGTPGRMVDMIERGVVNLTTIQYVVLDEARRNVEHGFQGRF